MEEGWGREGAGNNVELLSLVNSGVRRPPPPRRSSHTACTALLTRRCSCTLLTDGVLGVPGLRRRCRLSLFKSSTLNFFSLLAQEESYLQAFISFHCVLIVVNVFFLEFLFFASP